MGAWGHGSFENDTAGDWVWELEECADFTVVQSALDAVAKQQQDLGSDTCCEGLAAAEVVAAALGRPLEPLPEEVAKWLCTPRNLPQHLPALARDAVAAIATKSELRELWAEVDSFAAWERTVRDLQQRLT